MAKTNEKDTLFSDIIRSTLDHMGFERRLFERAVYHEVDGLAYSIYPNGYHKLVRGTYRWSRIDGDHDMEKKLTARQLRAQRALGIIAGLQPWEYGPEKDFFFWKNIPCAVVKNPDTLTYLGYAIIPIKLDSKLKEQIENLSVHGGVTWFGFGKDLRCAPVKYRKHLWVGFDCAHIMDHVPGIRSPLSQPNGRTYKTFEWVKKETRLMAMQIYKLIQKQKVKPSTANKNDMANLIFDVGNKPLEVHRKIVQPAIKKKREVFNNAGAIISRRRNRRRHPGTKQHKGFSLLELLIVVAIIGILTAIAAPMLLHIFAHAADVIRTKY